VIVVGAGPGGAASAFFLARAGIDVTVLDRAKFPRDKACSEYMSPQASRILDLMGTLEAVETSGAAQLIGMRVHAPGGAIVHGEFAAPHGFHGYRDRGFAVRRTILDAILLDSARNAGATIEESVKVTDLMRDGRGRVTGVHAVDRDGRSIERRASMVIGADGLRSVVGRRLGVIRRSRWPRRIALVSHYAGVTRLGSFGEMHVDAEGYCGFAALGNGVTNFSVVVPESRAVEVARDKEAFLDRWITSRPSLKEIFDGAARIDPVRATGPFAASARRAWMPGAALVGDAAEFFDPFTGEGIYTALRGGEILSGFAEEAVRAPTSDKSDRALAGYEQSRRREFSGKWKVEKIIGTVIAFPALLDHAAGVLARRRDMADLLVGVVGDFIPAREVLRPGYLLSLLFSPTGRA
jgi:flavin-dependent dehydrogenase